MCVNVGVHSEIFWFKFMTKNGKYFGVDCDIFGYKFMTKNGKYFGVDCDIFGYKYIGKVFQFWSALQNLWVQV